MTERPDMPWETLRAVRTSQALTITDLARRAEMNLNHVSRLERGQLKPTATTVAKLAEALGVPIGALAPPDVHRAELESWIRRLAREEAQRVWRENGGEPR